MNSKSFTLIELLVVISILGLLSGLILLSLQGAKDQADISKAQEFSHTVRVSLGANLVMEWKFDDESDPTRDSAGYDNDGDLVHFDGTATSGWTDNGIFGKALVFDGDDGDSTGDYVVKNPFNDFPTTAITIEFWMKSSNTTKLGTPVSYAVPSQTNEIIIYDYGGFRPHIKGSSVNTGVSANDGLWHHIVVTWKSSGGEIKLYKDGDEEYSGTIQAGATLSTGGALVLGQEQDAMVGGFSAGQAFLGTMDEVRIYDKDLSSAEVQQQYAQGAAKHGITLK